MPLPLHRFLLSTAIILALIKGFESSRQLPRVSRDGRGRLASQATPSGARGGGRSALATPIQGPRGVVTTSNNGEDDRQRPDLPPALPRPDGNNNNNNSSTSTTRHRLKWLARGHKTNKHAGGKPNKVKIQPMIADDAQATPVSEADSSQNEQKKTTPKHDSKMQHIPSPFPHIPRRNRPPDKAPSTLKTEMFDDSEDSRKSNVLNAQRQHGDFKTTTIFVKGDTETDKSPDTELEEEEGSSRNANVYAAHISDPDEIPARDVGLHRSAVEEKLSNDHKPKGGRATAFNVTVPATSLKEDTINTSSQELKKKSNKQLRWRKRGNLHTELRPSWSVFQTLLSARPRRQSDNDDDDDDEDDSANARHQKTTRRKVPAVPTLKEVADLNSQGQGLRETESVAKLLAQLLMDDNRDELQQGWGLAIVPSRPDPEKQEEKELDRDPSKLQAQSTNDSETQLPMSDEGDPTDVEVKTLDITKDVRRRRNAVFYQGISSKRGKPTQNILHLNSEHITHRDRTQPFQYVVDDDTAGHGRRDGKHQTKEHSFQADEYRSNGGRPENFMTEGPGDIKRKSENHGPNTKELQATTTKADPGRETKHGDSLLSLWTFQLIPITISVHKKQSNTTLDRDKNADKGTTVEREIMEVLRKWKTSGMVRVVPTKTVRTKQLQGKDSGESESINPARIIPMVPHNSRNNVVSNKGNETVENKDANISDHENDDINRFHTQLLTGQIPGTSEHDKHVETIESISDFKFTEALDTDDNTGKWRGNDKETSQAKKTAPRDGVQYKQRKTKARDGKRNMNSETVTKLAHQHAPKALTPVITRYRHDYGVMDNDDTNLQSLLPGKEEIAAVPSNYRNTNTVKENSIINGLKDNLINGDAAGQDKEDVARKYINTIGPNNEKGRLMKYGVDDDDHSNKEAASYGQNTPNNTNIDTDEIILETQEPQHYQTIPKLRTKRMSAKNLWDIIPDQHKDIEKLEIQSPNTANNTRTGQQNINTASEKDESNKRNEFEIKTSTFRQNPGPASPGSGLTNNDDSESRPNSKQKTTSKSTPNGKQGKPYADQKTSEIPKSDDFFQRMPEQSTNTIPASQESRNSEVEIWNISVNNTTHEKQNHHKLKRSAKLRFYMPNQETEEVKTESQADKNPDQKPNETQGERKDKRQRVGKSEKRRAQKGKRKESKDNDTRLLLALDDNDKRLLLTLNDIREQLTAFEKSLLFRNRIAAKLQAKADTGNINNDQSEEGKQAVEAKADTDNIDGDEEDVMESELKQNTNGSNKSRRRPRKGRTAEKTTVKKKKTNKKKSISKHSTIKKKKRLNLRNELRQIEESANRPKKGSTEKDDWGDVSIKSKKANTDDIENDSNWEEDVNTSKKAKKKGIEKDDGMEDYSNKSKKAKKEGKSNKSKLRQTQDKAKHQKGKDTNVSTSISKHKGTVKKTVMTEKQNPHGMTVEKHSVSKDPSSGKFVKKDEKIETVEEDDEADAGGSKQQSENEDDKMGYKESERGTVSGFPSDDDSVEEVKMEENKIEEEEVREGR